MQNPKLITALILSALLNMLLIGSYFLFIKEDTTPFFHPFKVNFNVTESSLREAGYEDFPEDVPILSKSINDTSIRFQLHFICETVNENFFFTPPTKDNEISAAMPSELPCEFPYVLSKSCSIKLNRVDSIEIVELIEQYGGRITSDWSLNMPYPSFDINYENKIQFRGSIQTHTAPIKRLKPRYTLEIYGILPLSEKQLNLRDR